MPVYDYRIAAGHNVALVSLTNVESIAPSGDTAFYAPRSWGTYTAGAMRVRSDGTLYAAGYASVMWRFGLLTRAQFRYLQTTYCAGAYSGDVTIYTRLDDATQYVRCNAVMVLPQLAELNNDAFVKFRDVEVKMTRIEVL